MFGNRSYDVVSFNSELLVSKSEQSSNVQTTEVVCISNDVQTVETRDSGTQTDVEQKRKPQVDFDKLAAFLRKVTPNVIEALDEAYGTNAFDDYNPKTDKDTLASVHLLKQICTREESATQIKISDLSWSTGGGTLAISHSIVYHETWCDHLSKVQFYNFTKEDEFPDVPNKTLETNACVTSLAYHPTEPSILAAGLFSGDVLVWNLRDDHSVTPVHVSTHGDTVSQIYWKLRTLTDVPLLISSSRDGYILSHKLTANFTTVVSHKRFKIIKEYNPVENSRPRSAGGSRERAAEAGLNVSSFDFSCKDPTTFIVGTLCGGIYKCSLDRTTPIEGDGSLLDPVMSEYERHEGSITCVKCSPTLNLFVTSGTDKEIRIYNFDQNVCHQSIAVDNTVVGLTWMIGNRDIFATYGAGPTIKFYNVTDGKAAANVKLEAPGRENTSGLRINSKRELLAIGDTNGNVEIWKVPQQLF